MAIYNGDKRDTTAFESTSFLQINSCGVQKIIGDDYIQITRKKGRCDYHILFVSEGECDIKYKGKIYNAKKGNVVLYPPHTEQLYTLYRDSKTIWVHFNGYDVENVLSEAKICGGVHLIPHSIMIEKMLFQLLTEHNSKLSVTNEKGLLLSILYNLGKTINDDICNKNEIYSCIELITSNYCTNISVEELASYCNLSKSRFLHLFKKITQTSPVAFQQELRIDNAKLLLSSTQLSISDISFRCGYDDPLYFSRLFKKKTGISPKEYRKIYQNI